MMNEQTWQEVMIEQWGEWHPDLASREPFLDCCVRLLDHYKDDKEEQGDILVILIGAVRDWEGCTDETRLWLAQKLTEADIGSKERLHFKIRNRLNGLYSGGGASPYFNDAGKVWNLRGLGGHLGLVRNRANTYANCDIVVVEEKINHRVPVTEFLNEKQRKKEEKAARSAERKRIREIARKERDELALFKRLKEKYE